MSSILALRLNTDFFYPLINATVPAETYDPHRIVIHEYERTTQEIALDPITGDPRVDKNGDLIYETKTEIITEKIESPHMGVDFEARESSYVVAACGGIVSQVTSNAEDGTMVILRHDSGYTTIYKHLSSTLVSVGAELVMGEPIGQIGTTGSCTPYDTANVPNVHFEMRDASNNLINPMPQLHDWSSYLDIPLALIAQYSSESWEDWAQSDVPGNIEWTGEKYMWPLPGYTQLSSPFGWRMLNGKRDLHRGLDIPAPRGTPIYAAADGVVSTTAHWSYGVCVKVSVAGNMVNIYGHMAARAQGITDGVMVTAGQLIGYVGSTGNSSGNHLHFEVDVDGKPVDPNSYF